MTRVTEEVLHVLCLVNFTLGIAIIPSGITAVILGRFFCVIPAAQIPQNTYANVHQMRKLPDLRDSNWTIRVSNKFQYNDNLKYTAKLFQW